MATKIISDAQYITTTEDVTVTAVPGKQYYYKNVGTTSIEITYGTTTQTVLADEMIIIMYDGENWNNLKPSVSYAEDNPVFDSLGVTNDVIVGGAVTINGSISAVLGELPIGSTIVQFPNKKSPSELGLVGTWENISSEFAGDFFRAEGGNASTFESGEQLDRFQGHRHSSNTSINTAIGVHGFLTGNTDNPGDVFRIESPTTDGTNGTPRTGIETNPVNHTIRIWERTA